jgi:hypothetical protein
MSKASREKASEAQANAHASPFITLTTLLSNYQNKKHSSHLMRNTPLEQRMPLPPGQAL